MLFASCTAATDNSGISTHSSVKIAICGRHYGMHMRNWKVQRVTPMTIGRSRRRSRSSKRPERTWGSGRSARPSSSERKGSPGPVATLEQIPARRPYLHLENGVIDLDQAILDTLHLLGNRVPRQPVGGK